MGEFVCNLAFDAWDLDDLCLTLYNIKAGIGDWGIGGLGIGDWEIGEMGKWKREDRSWKLEKAKEEDGRWRREAGS